MPSINLRLTDEQHAQIDGWASSNNRSIQKEIVHRLFPPHPLHDAIPQAPGRIGGKRYSGPDEKPSSEKKGRR